MGEYVERQTYYERGLDDGRAMERNAVMSYLASEQWGVCTEDQQDCCWHCVRLQAAEAIDRGFHIDGLKGGGEGATRPSLGTAPPTYGTATVTGTDHVSSCYLASGVVDVDLAGAVVYDWSAGYDDDDWIIRGEQ